MKPPKLLEIAVAACVSSMVATMPHSTLADPVHAVKNKAPMVYVDVRTIQTDAAPGNSYSSVYTLADIMKDYAWRIRTSRKFEKLFDRALYNGIFNNGKYQPTTYDDTADLAN